MKAALLVLVAACGLPPEVPAAPDAASIATPDAGGLDPLGSWSVTATPTDGCSFGLFIGGARLDVAAGTPLVLSVGGELLDVIDVADCTSTACHVEAREGGANTGDLVTYLLDFAGAEVSGVALSGPSCSIPVEGSRAP